MNDATTYLIISAICGVFMGIVKVLYDSKCVHVKCCFGLVDVERDVKTEIIDEENKHHHNEENNNNNNSSHQNIRFNN
jgi:hypothetical protein